MIRIARVDDLDHIMIIVNETIEDLNKEENIQWSKDYPKRENFEKDIKNASLYIYENNCEVAGFICIDKNEDSSYKSLNWRKQSDAIVIHRFAIKRSHQRQKIATKMIEFAENFSKNKQINYLKVDTNSKNIRMNALFKKLGFEFVGNVYLRDVKDPFNCYDKVLD
ncbi:MAG: acetyltransferase [Haloplasmataceae bacterium]|jgi:ribosomal protein S18 acetylase RimI-like enzyme|nr:acetyltransferase [Haloplasmataceae bacterium]